VVPADQSGTGADLTISQADVDSLIRSKAAMYTILETITISVGITLGDLKRFYVAGTFGSFIDPRSAITIGMLPDLPLDTYRVLGNSSLGGATLALTSVDCLAEMDRIRDRITYLELNVNQEFMNRFSAAKFLPHTNLALFPSAEMEGNDLDLRKTSKIPVKRKKLRSALFTADSHNLSVKDQIAPRIGSANRLVKQDWIAGTGIQYS